LDTMKTQNDIEIVPVDYNDKKHRTAIPFLLNEYAIGLLGHEKELEATVLENVVDGLEKFPNSIVLLAKTDDRYVGMIICFMGFSTFKAKPLLNIHDILVLKEYRNQSIGNMLLSEVEKIAQDKKCCKITLEVQQENKAARRLYNNFGFQHSFLDEHAGNQLFLTKEIER